MKKKYFLCLAFMLLFVVSLTYTKTDIMAAQNPELKAWNLKIGDSKTSSKITTTIKGNSVTKKINATITLYCKTDGKFKKIKSWSNLSTDGYLLCTSKYYSFIKNKTYKIIISGVLSNNQKSVTFRKSKVIQK